MGNNDNSVNLDTLNFNNDNIKNQYFIIDTNIWMWLLYAKHVPENKREQVTKYIDAIEKIKEYGGILVYSALTFSELATNIERMEHGDYLLKQGVSENYRSAVSRGASTKKQLRKIEELRESIAEILKEVFNQLSNIADISASDTLSHILPDKFVDQFSKTRLDGTDILITLSANDDGIYNFITDDADYGTVSDIKVYTLNSSIL